MRALRALERADMAILVIDATIGASHQDQRLAERIGVSGCPALVALNKWELVPVDERDDVLAGIGDRLAFLGAAPVLEDLCSFRQRACTGSSRRYATPLRRITNGCRPARSTEPSRSCRAASPPRGHASATSVQGAIDPPTFTLFTSGRMPQTYLRYIERGLREKFDFGPTPTEAARAHRGQVRNGRR